MEFLLGKVIYGFRSTKIELHNAYKVKEAFMDYKSEIRLFDDQMPNQAQLIEVNGKWEENEDFSDYVGISFKIGAVLTFKLSVENEKAIKSMSSLNLGVDDKNKFTIQKIDLFGYDINFNKKAPTKHIVLFTGSNEEQILMYPMTVGVGLRFLFSKDMIDSFFKSSTNHELLYLANTFTLEKTFK